MSEQSQLVEYALRLGDDALVLAQRLGEWVARAPELEEDVAMANVALDLLGQARALLTYAGEVEGAGRDEDALAYWRDDRDFRNALLVEAPGGDFAVTTARQLVFAAYQYELYERLRSSADQTLAAIAGKAVKEVHYHRDHATQWVLRLGDGTEESHRRMRAGLDTVWPYVDELFDADDLTAALSAGTAPIAVDPAELRDPWQAYVGAVLAEAGLEPPDDVPARRGGRQGLHTEHLGHLLAELQHLHRSHPGATW
ncbi:1,2-phenylacetyl-CoA epoxidase subunit PaaC [Jiangella asiatica]|uniref:Phenylacetate-CoA oxygenase subunit PaaI n=1 Tax=Jiangella asiatica TaxID=2530372 RepID=A0A4R5DPF5_9ACTN|nr:1,2-phenylacetyl-CoA epoxidase subunit PaaC [Jiangella asiatica]TDE14050.1 phenylacetate-CoA oxygenase subunit PaaI [Jiangella asiatica]